MLNPNCHPLSAGLMPISPLDRKLQEGRAVSVLFTAESLALSTLMIEMTVISTWVNVRLNYWHDIPWATSTWEVRDGDTEKWAATLEELTV